VKRLVSLVALAALVATATAFAGTAAAPPTKKPGTLVVGFDLPAPGFWNGAATGTTIRNPSGFEYDLSQALAKKLGIAKVEYLRSPFGALFSPGKKKFDLAFEEVTITKQRAKAVSFSAPYFDANQGVLIRKGLTPPKKIADLKSLQLCAQATTTGLDWIQHVLRPAKKPRIYSPSTSAVFDALEVKQCDAVILDVPIVYSQKRKKPGAYGPVAGQIATNESYGAVMEKGSPLKASVDGAIKALKADGTIDKLQKKWLAFTRVPVLK
jgi:polar amino acid transport system substrate-binding protein